MLVVLNCNVFLFYRCRRHKYSVITSDTPSRPSIFFGMRAGGAALTTPTVPSSVPLSVALCIVYYLVYRVVVLCAVYRASGGERRPISRRRRGRLPELWSSAVGRDAAANGGDEENTSRRILFYCHIFTYFNCCCLAPLMFVPSYFCIVWDYREWRRGMQVPRGTKTLRSSYLSLLHVMVTLIFYSNVLKNIYKFSINYQYLHFSTIISRAFCSPV